MIDREKREYNAADLVFVLSGFAYNSFLEQGYPKHKLRVIPLGSKQSLFRLSKAGLEARYSRIRAGDKLRVLSVGTFSYRKGVRDLVEIARQCGPNFEFVFVGSVAGEARALRSEAAGLIRFVPRQRLEKLSEYYSWADLFIFPTIEDGFAAVLAEAQAAGLPILSTTNCAASDILTEGRTGWILPPWSPEKFAERLLWCHHHREDLLGVVRNVTEITPRDWAHVSRDFVRHCHEALCSQRTCE
jgi:glycosyltransferase involved in cell wall biosynthesis